jgi:hypothetical protein
MGLGFEKMMGSQTWPHDGCVKIVGSNKNACED